MGVCLLAYSISTENLGRVRADPPLVWRVLDGDDDTNYLKQLASDSKHSLIQRLFGKRQTLPTPQSIRFSEGERRALDVDKSWDGLRACIRYCAPQAPDMFAGDGKIGDFEVGYGHALYVRSETMSALDATLKDITEVQLLQALQSVNFKGVYLENLWSRNSGDATAYLLENYRDLQAFVRHCAAHQHGAILQFT